MTTNLPPIDDKLKIMSHDTIAKQVTDKILLPQKGVEKTETLVHSINNTKTKEKIKCYKCNKKLNITNFIECSCKFIFCLQHRFSYEHECVNDPKNKNKQQLTKVLVKVEADKLKDRI